MILQVLHSKLIVLQIIFTFLQIKFFYKFVFLSQQNEIKIVSQICNNI